MKRNPLIPFALIALFGIGLMLFFSVKGIGDGKEMAGGEKEKPKQEDIAKLSPEEIYKGKCISCHGENYEGGVGPKLAGNDLDVNAIKERIKNGGGGMPANLVPDEKKLDEMAKWVSELK
ncbi:MULTISPECIES: cytochrome c550 [Bacillaceae]|uniref:Cytochrome c n=1 Tax=Metabacillus sediminis TaxID=3117746 RepID=A0ABZ2NEE9_9BACI|nr:cytochrome c [Bacillus sp. SJS]KZZ85961.1 cytochrome C' [Bacillus sp. SJS]